MSRYDYQKSQKLQTEPMIGAIYHIDGLDYLLPRCKVLDFNEVPGGYDMFVECCLTGDEYGISTKDAIFTPLCGG